VPQKPEATYDEFRERWPDRGNPNYKNPAQTGPGQVICLGWDSSLHKFGIDRAAGVWNDYGNPDRFHCWLDLSDLGQDLSASWKGQHLTDGLPILGTDFETNGLRYAIEQFAYPRNGPPAECNGELSVERYGRRSV
jgi:hypothetical protein